MEGGFRADTHYVFDVPHNGYGFNLEVHDLPEPISKFEADLYFEKLTREANAKIDAEINVTISQCLRDGLTSLVYNLGYMPDQIAEAINNKSDDLNQIWINTGITVNGDPVEGLKARRRRELQYIESCQRISKVSLLSLILILLYVSN